MSGIDYSHESDTVMADAFRKAGLDLFNVQTPPDPRKARTHPLPRPARVSTSGQAPVTASGPENRPQLDLHGCSEDQAYVTLESFIKKCHRAGCREVLVITGKGSGKLKRLVPLWLEEGPIGEFVANTCVADPWDGGEGARYVRLQKGGM